MELTILSSLKAQVQYPLPSDFFATVMMKRGLEDGVCTRDTLESAEYKGCLADCLRQVILYPGSVSEGGVSISKADRADLLYIANALYREIGENPIGERPKVTFY